MRWRNIIIAVSVLAFAFTLALTRIGDFDIWWHLKCGELLVGHWKIPRQDLFSYTALGRAWVDGYLLAQAAFYLAWFLAGSTGVCVFGAALVTAAYALGIAVSRRTESAQTNPQTGHAGFVAALIAAMPAIYLAHPLMTPRPALFTPIFALINLWLLEDHKRRSGRLVWWVIPLTAIWTNCHPAFLLGPTITAIYVAGSLSNAPLRKRLLQVFGLQLLATLVNPYGPRIYYSVVSFISNPQIGKLIIEWQPLMGAPHVPPGVVPCFFAVVAIWLAGLVWNRRNARFEHVILFTIVAIGAFGSRRNLLLFGPIALPLISWTWSKAQLSSQSEKVGRTVMDVGAIVMPALAFFMIWFTASDRLYYYTNAFRSTGVGVQPALFPEGAAKLLKKEHIEGNLFHTYDMGGYLIFQLYPDYRVLIDGRAYLYPLEMFHLIEKDAFASPKTFKKVVSDYRIGAMLLPIYQEKTWPAIDALMRSPDWAAVQADDWGVLFVARRPGNDDVIRRYGINLLNNTPNFRKPETRGKFHWWSRVEYPWGPMYWARFYQWAGRADLALLSVNAALEYQPPVSVFEGLPKNNPK